MLPCFNCHNIFNHRERTICPYCGWDADNPIDCMYNESDKYNIRNKLRSVDWLQNVEEDVFLVEKKMREYKLKTAQNNVELHQSDLCRYFSNCQEIIEYCLKHYSVDDGSFIDLRNSEVVKKIELKYQLGRLDLELIVGFALVVAWRAVAKSQVDEIYEAMKLRKNKGLKEDTNIGFVTAEPHETKHQSNLMEELERLGNMYEKGLLTDEEFVEMKKKLIEE